MKRLIAVIVATAMLLTSAGCSQSNSGKGDNSGKAASASGSALKDGKMQELDMVFPGGSSSPASLKEVEEKVNAIVKKTMDATVKFKILEWGNFADQQKLALSSGEADDLVFTYSGTQTFANAGQIQPIDDYVQKYGQGAYAFVKDYISACKVNGKLYGLPTMHEYALKAGLICRSDLLKKLQIDASQIKSWDDVGNVLQKVHAAYPKMNTLVPVDLKQGMLEYYTTGLFDIENTDTGVGVYASDTGSKPKVVSTYNTPEYLSMAKVAYDWNKKGYFIKDATTTTDTRQELIAAGNSFGYIGQIHPGTVTQETKNSGYQMTAIPVTNYICTSNEVNFAQYMVPTASKAPAKAVAFLNLLYTNEDLQNLVMYGIEGKDYVVKDKAKDVIGYPSGVTAKNAGWNNEPWLSGDAWIAHVWETDPPEIWNNYRSWNNKAQKSPLFGFSYNTADMTTQISAIKNVVTKYRAVIESGYADPTETVKKFNQEMESAGVNDVVNDMQKQVDNWKK